MKIGSLFLPLFTRMSFLRLPGLIDPHVHVRDLGQSHKEDWATATAAALAGGFTCVLAMPNTQPPITDGETLTRQQAAARARARCDYGLHLGASAENVEAAAALAPQVAGLKMYLDQTFGPLRMDDLDSLAAHAARWPADCPLLVHAEGRTLAAAILAAHLAGRAIHICHVSRKGEIEIIRAAKEKGMCVTCEVCPHHLFLTLDHCGLPPGYIEVRPRLASQSDVDALWSNLDVIDCFATDHAPHTRAEKESASPPPGFPGLETALALWLTAVHHGRLTLDDVIARMHDNPRHIFGLPEPPETWIEVEADAEWTARGAEMLTRAKWTPFEGWRLRGRVTRVVLRGREVFHNGSILAAPGSGRDVREGG
jgi:carbamoyl-phosphate synthase/aspartate carbamoyltransferase/dihydroorotase